MNPNFALTDRKANSPVQRCEGQAEGAAAEGQQKRFDEECEQDAESRASILGGCKRLKSQTRVIQTFTMAFPVKAFFDAPTVADMTTIITENQANQTSEAELAQRFVSDISSTISKK